MKSTLMRLNPYGNFSSLQASPQKGFTLPELLIASMLIPLIIITVSNIFTSQVNIERRLLGAQSSENLRSRLSFLLESDVADGEKLIFPPSVSSDSDESESTLTEDITDCNSSTGDLFTIASPYLSGNAIAHACIVYSIVDGNLVRQGPPILPNGSLDYSAANNASKIVANNVNISITSGSPTKVSFDITLPSFIGAPARTYSVAYGTKNFRVGT
jgi:prepilin-type N-terminal cleavage/methylation domain-containing protein